MATETGKTTWTREDEARFAEMNERRARVIGERRRVLIQALQNSVPRGTPVDQEGAVRLNLASLADGLAEHADEVRDALALFDYGVRAADEPGAVS